MRRIISLVFITAVLFISCNKDGGKGEPGSGKEINEFVLDGVTYDIGQTVWSEMVEAITSTENSKHTFLLGYEDPSILKEGAKIVVSKDIVLTITRGDIKNSPTYTASEGKVTITILKILPKTIPYGPRGIVGTFSGEFEPLSSNEKKNISGRFHTTRVAP